MNKEEKMEGQLYRMMLEPLRTQGFKVAIFRYMAWVTPRIQRKLWPVKYIVTITGDMVEIHRQNKYNQYRMKDHFGNDHGERTLLTQIPFADPKLDARVQKIIVSAFHKHPYK